MYNRQRKRKRDRLFEGENIFANVIALPLLVQSNSGETVHENLANLNATHITSPPLLFARLDRGEPC